MRDPDRPNASYRSRQARLAGGRNREKGPQSRRPGSARGDDAVGADEERAGHVQAPGRLTLATSPNYARNIGRRAQPAIWSRLASGPMTRWAALFRETDRTLWGDGPHIFGGDVSEFSLPHNGGGNRLEIRTTGEENTHNGGGNRVEIRTTGEENTHNGGGFRASSRPYHCTYGSPTLKNLCFRRTNNNPSRVGASQNFGTGKIAMIDGGKDARQVGRDEMNLAEFPIAVLTETRPKGMTTLQFKGENGTLTVIGSEAYGLPTAIDADVIIGLLQLTKARTDFTERRVGFTRHELLRLLGWPDRGRYYQRLEESLDRWTTVTLKYDNCWWDNKARHRISARFHILSNVVISERPGRRRVQTERQRGLPLSYFTWDEIFFESCQDGNLKRLDLDTYFSLKSAVSKQMYRFLDKRFYHRPAWTFDLREFAHEHVGLGRNYADNGKLKEKLRPAIEELETINFLEPMAPAGRYAKVGPGAWRIRLVRKRPPPAAPKPEPGPGPSGLVKELVDRGVTRSVAVELVRDFPEDRIAAQIEHVDRTRRKIRDKAAFLVSAIQGNFATKAVARPTKSEPPAVKSEPVAVAVADQAVRQRAQTARAFWEGLTAEDRERIDAEALAQAAPAIRAEIEGERRPSLKRLMMSAVRDEYLKRIHDKPVAG